MDSSKGARRFSTVMTEAFLEEHFGKEPDFYCPWKTVVRAFQMSYNVMRSDGYGMGYEWDANKNLLSTAGLVTPHPEITLIQHLLESGDRGTEAYIGCSRTPCYASAAYADVVNETLKTRVRMHVDEQEFCQLYDVEPWVLPEDARSDVVAGLKKYLLRDLATLAHGWDRDFGGISHY